MQVDRQAIREVLATLQKPGAENEWCVACGAGAASSKLDYPGEIVASLGKQLTEPAVLKDFINQLSDRARLEQDWCVACGAGAAASPLARISDPATLSDAVVDEIAAKLISAVKLG
ncbi:MAG: hypothetical protein WDN03_13380 [Rhizomicrobium sp.]